MDEPTERERARWRARATDWRPDDEQAREIAMLERRLVEHGETVSRLDGELSRLRAALEEARVAVLTIRASLYPAPYDLAARGEIERALDAVADRLARVGRPGRPLHNKPKRRPVQCPIDNAPCGRCEHGCEMGIA